MILMPKTPYRSLIFQLMGAQYVLESQPLPSLL